MFHNRWNPIAPGQLKARRPSGRQRIESFVLRSFICAITIKSFFAQTPIVQLKNTTRPGSTAFTVGDRYQISIAGGANQLISVRTTLNGRLDWSPVIATTDPSGQWSTTGFYKADDFGDWKQVWTVGGKLASPTLSFSVSAPCLVDGRRAMFVMSLVKAETCDTAEGPQTFTTLSDDKPFRTPDGRIIPGLSRSAMTEEQSRIDLVQNFIVTGGNTASARTLRQFGDEAAILIKKTIGPNALLDDELQRVLMIIIAAFERRDRIPPTTKNPTVTVPFLQALAETSGNETLKQQITNTITSIQNRQPPSH